MTCRKWLSENGYDHIVALIDEAMVKMTARGSEKRRNWWGHPLGRCRRNTLCVRRYRVPLVAGRSRAARQADNKERHFAKQPRAAPGAASYRALEKRTIKTKISTI